LGGKKNCIRAKRSPQRLSDVRVGLFGRVLEGKLTPEQGGEGSCARRKMNEG